MTEFDVLLAGCRPEPMASYLKALGVLRLLAEQADGEAAGGWESDGFRLRSSLDDQALEEFFLGDYRPTPVVSPWNSSSGFGPEGAGGLNAIEGSTTGRLEGYRLAIGATRRILDRYRWLELPKKVRDAKKLELLRACRSELPDECLPWLDAAIVLTDGEPAYPPLLGTGGNVGRFDLSRNFHEHVVTVLGLAADARRQAASAERSRAWLQDSLWGLGKAGGVKKSPGQFDPGSGGGTNSSPFGKAPVVVNPWDYVLMVEGMVMFAAGTARRLGGAAGQHSAAPFCADVASVGYPGAAEEHVRGEVWLPLWAGRMVGLAELRRLLSEGRIDWRGRHARTGLDFAKATSTLGVDRGITAFSRYVLAERFGQNTVAVPVGRIAVGRQVWTARPLADLDGWLNRIRATSDLPASVRLCLRRVDSASFEATQGVVGALARLLVDAAALEAAVGRSSRLRERIPPVPGLPARRWVTAVLGPANDAVQLRGSRELRLAMAFASAHDRTNDGRAVSRSLRTLVRPIVFSAWGVAEWTPVAPVEGLGVRRAIEVVAGAHVRRSMEVLAERRRHSKENRSKDESAMGMSTRFARAHDAPLEDVAALVAGDIDSRLFGDLLGACLLLDWTIPPRAGWLWGGRGFGRDHPVPPALTVLGPFYARQPVRKSGERKGEEEAHVAPPDDAGVTDSADVVLRPEPEWPALLMAGRSTDVMSRALRRLWFSGCRPVARGDGGLFRVDRAMSLNLCAALLCPMSKWAAGTLIEAACPPEP